MAKVYIYSTDKFGNPGPFYTTLSNFQKCLKDAGLGSDSGDPVVLHEDIDENILDQDNHLVLIPATKGNIEIYFCIDDPLNLMDG